MNLTKNTYTYFILIIIGSIFYSCTNDDDCTKMVNIPKWDPIEMSFVDDFQEVSCDFEGPVDEPVNGKANKSLKE